MRCRKAAQPHLDIDQHPHRGNAAPLAGAETLDRLREPRGLGVGAQLAVGIGEQIEIAAEPLRVGQPVVVRQPQPDLAAIDQFRIQEFFRDALEQRLGHPARRADVARQRIDDLRQRQMHIGHARLDRGRHRHLVLPHQQRFQIRDLIDREQPVAEIAKAPAGLLAQARLRHQAGEHRLHGVEVVIDGGIDRRVAAIEPLHARGTARSPAGFSTAGSAPANPAAPDCATRRSADSRRTSRRRLRRSAPLSNPRACGRIAASE